MNFKEQIQQGIPSILPEKKEYDKSINHAPKRKEILTNEEKELALRNALRYFDPKHHAILLPEFREELENYGDRKSTRLNSSHVRISYAVFCLKKKKKNNKNNTNHLKKA